MSSGKYIPPLSLFFNIQQTADKADIDTGVIVGVCQKDFFLLLYRNLFFMRFPIHTGLNLEPNSKTPTYSVPSLIFSLYTISAFLGYLNP